MTRLMIRPARTIGSQGLSSLAGGLIVATLIVLFLYMGREILEPLVIAGLLGFILSPLIRRLRGWGLWRVPSVIITVLFAIAVIAALGSTIVLQVAQLAEELPKYETNLRTKIRALGAGSLMSSSLERASDTLKDLQNEITKSGAPTTTAPGQKPLLVEVRQPEPRGLESIANVVRPLAVATGDDRACHTFPDCSSCCSARIFAIAFSASREQPTSSAARLRSTTQPHD